MAMPSPITCIQWWRICLDEAQMIESTRAKTAEMALRLSAVNKWCVTGKQHICYQDNTISKHFLIKKVFSNLYGSFAKVISVLQKEINLPQNI